MKNKNQRGELLGFLCFAIVFTVSAIISAYISHSFSSVIYGLPASSDVSRYPTIIIDAGHGGEDGGTVGINGVLEKDINLKIAFCLYDMLRISGYDVVMTRKDDTLLYNRNVDYKGRKKALDLAARVSLANNYEDCIFISIHMNSFPDQRYSGLQVYYSKNHANSKLLAEAVQGSVCGGLQKQNNRQVKLAGSNIFVLDRIKQPAILIECGFLSNAEESALLTSEEYRKQLSLAIFQGIVKYISAPS